MKKIFTVLGIVATAAVMNAQTNLIQNSGFETWTNGTPDGWYTSGITYTQATNSHSGNYSAGVTSPKPTGTNQSANKTINPTPDIPVKQGVTYVFSGWYLDNTPDAQFRFWNQFRTDSGDTGGNAMQGSDYSVDSPAWQFFSAEAIPNTNATFARPGLRVYGSTTANGGIIYFDDIMFYDKASLGANEVSASKHRLIKNTMVDADHPLTFATKSNVQIFDMTGKMVKSAEVNADSTINVNELPKGTYIVKGLANGEMSAQKFIKK